MDAEQLKVLIQEAIRNASWWPLILVVLASVIGGYFGTYVRERAKNLATIDDIDRITDQIEQVRQKYNEELESVKASLQLSNQLKSADLETRLKKHQEAYSLWMNAKLLATYPLKSLDENLKIIVECEKWWNDNCLYLNEESRASFKNAYTEALKVARLGGTGVNLEKPWDIIEKGGKAILEAVGHYHLGTIETQELKNEGRI